MLPSKKWRKIILSGTVKRRKLYKRWRQGVGLIITRIILPLSLSFSQLKNLITNGIDNTRRPTSFHGIISPYFFPQLEILILSDRGNFTPFRPPSISASKRDRLRVEPRFPRHFNYKLSRFGGMNF